MPDTRPRAAGKSLIELEVRVAHPLRPRDDQDQAEFLRLPRSLWVGAGASSPVFQGRSQSLPFETLSQKKTLLLHRPLLRFLMLHVFEQCVARGGQVPVLSS